MWVPLDERPWNPRRTAMVAGATLLVIALLVVGVGIAAIIATERDLDSLHLGDVATYTGPTLPPLPASQCASLRGVHKAALAARDIASPLSMPQEPWPTLRRRVNNTLLVFDVALQHAEHAVPAQLAGELHSVRRHVQRGRIFAATSASESAYQGAVLAEVIDGYRGLSNASAMLGSGCGEHFALAPEPA